MSALQTFRMPILPISRDACPFGPITNQPLGVEVKSIQGLEAFQDGQLGEASREGVLCDELGEASREGVL